MIVLGQIALKLELELRKLSMLVIVLKLVTIRFEEVNNRVDAF